MLSRNAAPGRDPWAEREPRLLFWAISIGCLIVLASGALSQWHELAADGLELVPWVLLLCLVNLLPVSGLPYLNFAPDIPIMISSMLLLTPLEAGLVAFAGCVDPQEFRGGISVSKAVYNRAQGALASLAGSLSVHAVTNTPETPAFILPLAFLCLAVSSSVNYTLVALGVSRMRGLSLTSVVRRMQVGRLSDYSLTFVAWGVLGAMLAALYREVRPLALLAFLGPVFLGRQTLSRSQMSVEAQRAYDSREAALKEMARTIHEERSDERRLIAADLHDEVLQPLFKVSLLARVLETELATGRLLEMDQDVPDLLSAAELAAASLRSLISDLRRSTLGKGGLGPAVARLVDNHSRQAGTKVNADIDSVHADPSTELAIYQIAKEALGNSLAHSKADHLWISLRQNDAVIRLTVRDNGVGFDSMLAKDGHYGLHIMRERAQSSGGSLFVDSAVGLGTCVSAIFPEPEKQDANTAGIPKGSC
jgi:signal transduction histidine kinase